MEGLTAIWKLVTLLRLFFTDVGYAELCRHSNELSCCNIKTRHQTNTSKLGVVHRNRKKRL